jgi:RNA polymerase sigma-70 factor (ECF subfamily)
MDRQQTTALLERARAGSEDALNELFERWAGRLLALVRLRMGPALRARMESRDILQAALLKAFRNIERFESSDARSLMAWLGRIVENEIRDQADHQRRQRRDAAREVVLSQGLDAVEARVRSQVSLVVLDEELARVERALEALEPDHREVIVLRKFEELGFGEIGRRMQRSPDACRMLLARAMAALTLQLREMS